MSFKPANLNSFSKFIYSLIFASIKVKISFLVFFYRCLYDMCSDEGECKNRKILNHFKFRDGFYIRLAKQQRVVFYEDSSPHHLEPFQEPLVSENTFKLEKKQTVSNCYNLMYILFSTRAL